MLYEVITANFGGWDFSEVWAVRGVFWRAWTRGGETRAFGVPSGPAALRAALAGRLAALAPQDQGGALLRALIV